MNSGNKGNRVAVKTGIGFWGLLAIVLIVLRLCGVINWHWVWVLTPLWGPVILVNLIVLIALLIDCLSRFVDWLHIRAMLKRQKRTEYRD